MKAGKIPASAADLFEKRSLGYLSTIGPGGTPQVTPVWVDLEGDLLLVNTALGRVKERNLRANPKVGIAVCDPENPYRFLSVQGSVRFREEGADAHIDRLAQRYLGKETYPNRQPGEVRVILEITPDKVYSRL